MIFFKWFRKFSTPNMFSMKNHSKQSTSMRMYYPSTIINWLMCFKKSPVKREFSTKKLKEASKKWQQFAELFFLIMETLYLTSNKWFAAIKTISKFYLKCLRNTFDQWKTCSVVYKHIRLPSAMLNLFIIRNKELKDIKLAKMTMTAFVAIMLISLKKLIKWMRWNKT